MVIDNVPEIDKTLTTIYCSHLTAAKNRPR